MSLKYIYYERSKLGIMHYTGLLGHIYFKFGESVSLQISGRVKQIFFRKMKGRGIISWSDAEWHLMPRFFVLFQAYFFKTACLGILAKWTYFTNLNCITKTAFPDCFKK